MTVLKLCFLCFLLFILLLIPARGAEVITPEQAAEGWIALFDGETLFGWQPTSDANWRVENGEIRVDSNKKEGKEGWLMTTSEFADYQLHVEFKAPNTSNSGVFLRTPLEPKDPMKDCYEVNIAPADNPFPTGSIVARFQYAPNARQLADEWHTFVITVTGSSITVDLDGEPPITFSQFEGPMPPSRGRIGLQFREGAVAFRNVRLKPLGLKPLFNGKDFTGWNTKLADKSEFAVTPAGELAVKNGPGQLETNDTFGNFVMQLDCQVNGDGLNSGIFFRCIPGDKLMGYESQIHNGMVDGDPTKPVDAGTGAIYRRSTARCIVASDHEWFTKTLLVDGPHVAVWVNGYQVTDWTDDRPADENPRKGLRTKPGTIAIQGHDPTTDLLFRNLNIAELPDITAKN
jgi:hypothetical protein